MTIITIEPEDIKQAEDVISGTYERMRHIRPGDKVLDIGAHVGYFTMLAARKVGPKGFVVAFEPHPVIFERLEKNCKGLKNVELVNAGALDEDKTMNLWEEEGNSGGNSFFKPKGRNKYVPTNVLNIGKWLAASHFMPTVVKIDAERSENLILESLMAINLKADMAIEIHSKELFDKCSTILKSNGYEISPDNFEEQVYYAYTKT